MNTPSEKQSINWEDFTKVDMRIGTIIQAEVFEKARQPAYKVWIDFGELGIKKSSAQLTKLYHLESLIGMQVVAVVNFPPKQIANFMSECLIMGAMGPAKEVILLQPEQEVPNGWKVG